MVRSYENLILHPGLLFLPTVMPCRAGYNAFRRIGPRPERRRRTRGSRGLSAPALGIADGALGFWGALDEVFPKTRRQRYWKHKTANVVNYLPKLAQPRVKEAIHEIWMAETRGDAAKAFDSTSAPPTRSVNLCHHQAQKQTGQGLRHPAIDAVDGL